MKTILNASRRTVLVAACTLACAVAAPQVEAWQWGKSEQVRGSGNVKHETRTIGHFNGLSVALPGDVDVRTGNTEGITIEADDNLLPLIETVVEDGTLKIRPRRNANINARHLKIVVQARELERVALAGSADIEVDSVRGARMKFDIGGSGEIKVKRVEGESLNVNLGGSGELEVEGGSARSMSVSIGGSGDIDLKGVRADSASVSLAGSGDATLWVRNSLNVTVAGSGTVGYYGDPQVSKSTVGSGTVRRLGAAPN